MPTASHIYSLFYWNTTTDRLAPETVIVNMISQWQSVLQNLQSELLHFRKISCDTILSLRPYVATRSSHPDWKLFRLLHWRPEHSRLSSPADEAHDLSMCGNGLILELLFARWKMYFNLASCNIHATKYSYKACQVYVHMSTSTQTSSTGTSTQVQVQVLQTCTRVHSLTHSLLRLTSWGS